MTRIALRFIHGIMMLFLILFQLRSIIIAYKGLSRRGLNSEVRSKILWGKLAYTACFVISCGISLIKRY
jgi:hypothetical protein